MDLGSGKGGEGTDRTGVGDGEAMGSGKIASKAPQIAREVARIGK